MTTKILYVEDEPALATIITDALEAEGFTVFHCSDGPAALRLYQAERPHLLLLDVMLPKSSGFTVAKTIRNTDPTTPILFLTAKAKTQDVIEGFQSGGNDYLRKPFSVEELIVRMQVLLSPDRLLHQTATAATTHFSIGRFQFDSRKQELRLDGTTHRLTAREAELLQLFCAHPNELLTKKSILLNVWGDDSFFHSRSMDVYISKLRKLLKADPSVEILNVRGRGYKLITG